MVFVLGDIAIGGQHEYVEVMHSDTTLNQMVHVTDTNSSEPQTYVTGVTFNPISGDLFTSSSYSLTADFTPHDIDWIPDNSGLLVPVVPGPGQLEFWKYDYSGNVIDTFTNPNVETGWAQQPVKISVACDARTVFYTQSLHKIQRYDLVTRANLTDYETLPADSHYIYGGLRLLPAGMTTIDGKHLLVAMTLTGDGPQRALCLDSDGIHHWVDEINPTAGYHIQKRRIDTGIMFTQILTQYDTNPAHNDKTLSLACFYNICGQRMPIMVTLIS